MLNEMEKRALEMLLAGADDRLAILRSQLKSATVDRREMSGVGFFTHFSIPVDAPLQKVWRGRRVGRSGGSCLPIVWDSRGEKSGAGAGEHVRFTESESAARLQDQG